MDKESTHIVSKNVVGLRFDEAAVILFKLTRSQAQKMIKAGRININGEQKPAKSLVQKGDKVVRRLPERKMISIPVVYEDEDIIVIDKPSGVTVHPASGENDLTVTEILMANTEREIFIVHRLDKGTSGLMVLAKNDKAKRFLSNQFQKRKVEKIYYALVCGKLIPETGIIDIPLQRGEQQRGRFEPKEGGRQAKTTFRVIKYFTKYSYLELHPETGRTHQIRVHLSAIGHPILGDTRYGKGSNQLNRVFLHAAKLAFIHPSTKKAMVYTSVLPKELETVLQELSHKQYN